MEIFRKLQHISQGFLDIIIPPTCLSCQDVVEEQGQICGNCWPDMYLIGKYKCAKCGLPFEFDLGKNAKCTECQKSKPKYKKIIAATKHEGVARKLAINLKFNDRTQLAPYMAALMINMGREIIEKSDLIIPVPLHRRRQFFRKYNQSAVLAKEIAKQTGLEYNLKLLKRIKATTPQTKLSKKDRQSNVKDAFIIFNEYAVARKNILLIDDVMTTGSTINECAKLLKQAGAKNVYGLVFSRVSAH